MVLPSGTSINLKFKKSLKKDKLKIGYFGSINKSKGIDLIVKLAGIDRQNVYFICGGKKEQVVEYTRKNFHLIYLYFHIEIIENYQNC